MYSDILTKIKPSKDALKNFKVVSTSFLEKINKNLKDAKAIIGGSGARDTWLAGNHDIDVFVFHQASRIAVDSLVKQLELPTEKVVCELETVGNLVSASIPHALQQAMVKGSAKPGDLAVLCGFGVGLSWGTAIVRL